MNPPRPRRLSQSVASLPAGAQSAGGKGDHLNSLLTAGFDVPAFGVVATEVLDRFVEVAGLGDLLGTTLDGVSAVTARSASAAIEAAITDAEVDPETRSAVLGAYALAGGGSVAVRSSAVGEDGVDDSFAGQGDSFLHVEGDDAVVQHVLRCWASAWSERALEYRLLKGLPTTGIRTAVVIQAMVESEISGVLFTVNPATGTTEFVVSAVYGLGEGLVSGQVDADTITLSRRDGRVLHTQLGEKEERVEAGPGGIGVVSVPEDPARREALALSPGQLLELHRTGLAIEAHFGGPQDVEWGIAGNRLFVLQSRPVTALGRGTSTITPQSTVPPAITPDLRLWDNANIVENFGEITAPLTFSFANHMYGVVYLDYCRVLGVPASHLQKMAPWTRHMLGQFDGRVYYNVLNWYMVLKLVPLPSVQAKVLAATAGIRETTPEITAAQRPFAKWPRLERVIHARTYLGFTYRFFTAKRTVRHFLDEFNGFYEAFEREEIGGGRPAHETFTTYEDLEAWMSARWGPTAVLDAVISLSLGVLYGLTQKWLPDAPEWFLWQAIKVDDERVESAMPAERITAIAGRVRQDEALAELVRSAPVTTLQAAVEASSLPGAVALRAELEQYLVDFGDRALNELKLEEPDLREDPSIVWSMLRDAVVLPAAPSAAAPAGAEIQSADAWLEGKLTGPRKLLWNVVRRKVQSTLMSRENVRFARSRAFAMVRRLLREVGRDLAVQGLIEAPADVYMLRLEELRGVFHGSTDPGELRGLVELRRRRQAEQRAGSPPPPRFYTQGLPPEGALVEDVEDHGDLGLVDGVLRGRPSCPGVVEASARVVDAPRDVAGQVLVAYRTDPGWVGALSSASALLIERGSPLTHVAVVARELDIPTVVQIPGLTTIVQTGMRLRVDGGAGTVEILDEDATASQEENA